MEFELLPVLVGVAAGVLVGAEGKPLARVVKRGYRAIAGAAGGVLSGVREAWREGIEEARHDRDAAMVRKGIAAPPSA